MFSFKKVINLSESTKEILYALRIPVAFGLIYLGGWIIVWGEGSQDFLFKLLSKPFIIDEYGFIVLVNYKYYGFVNSERFFDTNSSWPLLGIAISLIFLPMFETLKTKGSENQN